MLSRNVLRVIYVNLRNHFYVMVGTVAKTRGGVLFFVSYHLFRQVDDILMESVNYFIIVRIVFAHD